MPKGKRKLSGRWLAPGESPFKETNNLNAKRRQQLHNAGRSRNEEMARQMNSRTRSW